MLAEEYYKYPKLQKNAMGWGEPCFPSLSFKGCECVGYVLFVECIFECIYIYTRVYRLLCIICIVIFL